MTATAQHLVICTQTFETTARGASEWITAGQIAEAKSWPVRHFPSAWAPLKVDYLADEKRQAKANAETPASVSPAAIMRRRGGRRPPEPTA